MSDQPTTAASNSVKIRGLAETNVQQPLTSSFTISSESVEICPISSTSLLLGASGAELLLVGGEHPGGGSVNVGEGVSTSVWPFNNLFHPMGHQQQASFSGDQVDSNYDHSSSSIAAVTQHDCGSSAAGYPNTASHYFNYSLNNEFADSTYATAEFFPTNLQPSYINNYGSNVPSSTSAASNLPVQLLNGQPEEEREDSNYSANSSSGDSSRSQSTDSSRKENPAFYPETTDTSSTAFHQRSPFETFCTVPGRTSLLSSTTKYKVTIGEIQRRISPPECLNASLLGGILRKAKSKDGGKALRESLRRIGLTLPAGRRKSAHVTALTALVEEEAVHMAKDFHSVCERDFPAKEIGQFLSRHVSSEEEAHQRRTMLHYVRIYIKELSDLINSDRSPVCGSRPDIILDSSIQKPLTHFSMVTHGFGGLIFLSVLDALNSSVHESIKHLDRAYNISSTHRTVNPYVFPS